MASTIIISPDLESRKQKILELLIAKGLSENHPDVLILEDEEKLGVEAVKKIKEFLSFKPYSAEGKGVAIISAQNLTHDAQNALLKTLEEPPLSSIILLGAESDKELLATVLSRCQVVILEGVSPIGSSSDFTSFQNDIERLIDSSVADRFEFIEKLEEKEEFLEALIQYFNKKLREDAKYLNFAKELMEAEKYKKANGNIRAILEYLMLVL